MEAWRPQNNKKTAAEHQTEAYSDTQAATWSLELLCTYFFSAAPPVVNVIDAGVTGVLWLWLQIILIRIYMFSFIHLTEEKEVCQDLEKGQNLFGLAWDLASTDMSDKK